MVPYLYPHSRLSCMDSRSNLQYKQYLLKDLEINYVFLRFNQYRVAIRRIAEIIDR